MPRPLVSVVVPAYGRPDRTQRAIDSVGSQTYSPIELLVIDDGSESPLSESLDMHKNRFKRSDLVRLNKNFGANVARNKGIEFSHGEYIAFLDSDDQWLPEKIENQVNAIEHSNAEVAYTSVEQVDSNGRLNGISEAVKSGNLRLDMLTGNKVGTFSSVLVDADVVTEVGTPDPELPCWQDWEWFLRLSESVRFIAINDVMVRRHNEGDQISNDFNSKYKDAYPAIRDRLESISHDSQERKLAVAYLDFHIGYAALVNGEYSKARRFFLQSIFKKPQNLKTWKFLAVSGSHYPMVRNLKRNFVRKVKT